MPSSRRRSRRPATTAARWRQALLTSLCCFAALTVVCTACFFLLRTPAAQASSGAASDVPQNPDAAAPDAAAPDGDQPAADPVVDESAQRVADAMATAGTNCTREAPQVTDPATWNDAGKALIDQLSADAFYVSEGINVSAKDGCPYLLAVNRAASTVTVYALDAENRYTVPYMAMVCSGGSDTPLGFFATPVNYDWRLLAGPSYGQYATRIWDAYLFHTVPYYSQHKDDVEYDEFNKLGTPASLGCIRLAVADVKWIYDNCPIGTRVVIYDDEANPGPMGKPGTMATDPADTEKRGWDPTDPDPANPWDDAFLTGTAIRSQAAWDEWNAAAADGRWNTSLTPTDLQGWSTDSSVEGTRG